MAVSDDSARARAADPGAIIELETTQGQALFGFLRKLGLTDEDAADGVQEALLRVWTMMSAGKVVHDPTAMAFRIGYRLAMDSHRLRRRVDQLASRLTSMAEDRSAELIDAADQTALWRVVDRLPERQRQTIYLRYQADMTYESIAFVLGITPSAVRAHASLALRTLRAQLREETHDGRR